MAGDLLGLEFGLRINPASVSKVQGQAQRIVQNFPDKQINFALTPGSKRALQQGLQGMENIRTEAQRTDNSLNKLSDDIGRYFTRFSAFTLAATTIFSGIRALSEASDAALEFDRALVRVAQVTGSTRKGVRFLSDEVFRLGKAFGASTQGLFEASTTLAQAGFNANETRKALEALAKADVSATFGTVKDTVEGAVAILSQFELKTEDLEDALSSVNAVASNFAVESKDVISAVKKAGGIFAETNRNITKSSKESFNEFIGLFTAIRSTTRESAETIGVGLKTIFARLQRQSTINILENLGVSGLRDKITGEFVGATEAIAILANAITKFGDKSPEVAKITEQLGGVRQVGKVIPLLKNYDKALQATATALAGTNSLSEQAITAQDSLQIQFQRTTATFQEFITNITQDESFRGFIKNVNELTRGFINLLDAIRPVLPFLGVIGAVRAIRPSVSVLTGIKNRVPTFKANDGGFLPGSGTKDDVPALLTRGEFVINKDAVQKIGVDNLRKINRGNLPGFAHGGEVGDIDDRVDDLIKDMLSPTDREAAQALGASDISARGQSVERIPLAISENRLKLASRSGRAPSEAAAQGTETQASPVGLGGRQALIDVRQRLGVELEDLVNEFGESADVVKKARRDLEGVEQIISEREAGGTGGPTRRTSRNREILEADKLTRDQHVAQEFLRGRQPDIPGGRAPSSDRIPLAISENRIPFDQRTSNIEDDLEVSKQDRKDRRRRGTGRDFGPIQGTNVQSITSNLVRARVAEEKAASDVALTTKELAEVQRQAVDDTVGYSKATKSAVGSMTTLQDKSRELERTFKDPLVPLAKSIKDTGKATPGAIKDTLRATPGAIKDTLRATPGAIKDTLRATPGAVKRIGEDISTRARGVPGAVKRIGEDISTRARGVLDLVSEREKALGQSIERGVSQAFRRDAPNVFGRSTPSGPPRPPSRVGRFARGAGGLAVGGLRRLSASAGLRGGDRGNFRQFGTLAAVGTLGALQTAKGRGVLTDAFGDRHGEAAASGLSGALAGGLAGAAFGPAGAAVGALGGAALTTVSALEGFEKKIAEEKVSEALNKLAENIEFNSDKFDQSLQDVLEANRQQEQAIIRGGEQGSSLLKNTLGEQVKNIGGVFTGSDTEGQPALAARDTSLLNPLEFNTTAAAQRAVDTQQQRQIDETREAAKPVASALKNQFRRAIEEEDFQTASELIQPLAIALDKAKDGVRGQSDAIQDALRAQLNLAQSSRDLARANRIHATETSKATVGIQRQAQSLGEVARRPPQTILSDPQSFIRGREGLSQFGTQAFQRDLDITATDSENKRILSEVNRAAEVLPEILAGGFDSDKFGTQLSERLLTVLKFREGISDDIREQIESSILDSFGSTDELEKAQKDLAGATNEALKVFEGRREATANLGKEQVAAQKRLVSEVQGAFQQRVNAAIAGTQALQAQQNVVRTRREFEGGPVRTGANEAIFRREIANRTDGASSVGEVINLVENLDRAIESAGSDLERAQFRAEAENAATALKRFADVASRTKDIQERLNQLNASREARRGSVEQFINASPSEQAKLIRNRATARATAASGADPTKLSQTILRAVISGLKDIGAGIIPETGKTGTQTLNEILDKLGARGPAGEAGERKTLQQKVIEANKEAAAALSKLASRQETAFTKFITGMEKANRDFLDRLGPVITGASTTTGATGKIPKVDIAGVGGKKPKTVDDLFSGVGTAPGGKGLGKPIGIGGGGFGRPTTGPTALDIPVRKTRRELEDEELRRAFGLGPEAQVKPGELFQQDKVKTLAALEKGVQRFEQQKGDPVLGLRPRKQEDLILQDQARRRRSEPIGTGGGGFRPVGPRGTPLSRPGEERLPTAVAREKEDRARAQETSQRIEERKQQRREESLSKKEQLEQRLEVEREKKRQAAEETSRRIQQRKEEEERRRRLGLNSGGVVPGRGTGDSVPAMLTPGEFVLNKQATQAVGADNLNKVNQGARANFQDGGMVAGGINIEGLESLDKFNRNFGVNIERLSKAIESIPAEITMSVSHRVEHVFNGAQVFERVSPELKKLAEETFKQGLNKFLKDKLPDLGRV